MRLRSRSVKTLGVFFDHSMSVKHGCDAADGFTHELQPSQRKLAVRLGIVEGDDLIFEQLVEAGGVHFILEIDGAVSNLGADGPAIITIVTLAPPAIQHTEIKPTIGWRFHTAGAAGFEWTQRIIEPEIDPLNQAPRNVGVVIFNKNDAIVKTQFA